MLRRVVILVLLAAATASAAAPPRSRTPWLRADGLNLVDPDGRSVVLRGFNAGGAFTIELWMTAMDMDRGATNLPEIRDEKSMWEVLEQRFGREKMEELRRAWREAWFNPKDVDCLAHLGCNAVRVPFWYRLLEDDEHPGQLLPEGTRLLDTLLDRCRERGVYAILDLHGAPGGQSKEEHAGEKDRDELFRSPALQARTAQVWADIARRYRDRPEVAGYDLLNEPMGAPDAASLIAVHDQLYRAIRAVDPHHVIFMEDGYKGWDALPIPSTKGWQNVAYSIHIYRFGAMSAAVHEQVVKVELPRYREEQEKRSVPLFIGEFSTQTDAQGGVSTMAAYFRAFNTLGWSWTPWTFKQIDATDGRRSIWGLYTNDHPWKRATPYQDSVETLRTRFREYETGNLAIQPAYRDAVLAATGSAAPKPQ